MENKELYHEYSEFEYLDKELARQIKNKAMLDLKIKEFGLQETKAKQLQEMYLPMLSMLSALEDEYNDLVSKPITDELEKEAKSLRLRMARPRIDAEKAKTKGKAEYLRAGNAIQAVYNTFKFAVESKEEKLKEIENHSYNLGVEKLRVLEAERLKVLQQYQPLTISDGRLGGMDADVWDNYINGVKLNSEQVKAAEAKAEKERIEAEKAEQKRIKKIEAENKRLEKEAKEKDHKALLERQRIAKAYDEKLAKEKAEKQKLADELEANRVKEIKAKQAEEKAKQIKKDEAYKLVQAELNKGDADKIKDLIEHLKEIKTEYTFKSAKNNKMFVDVCGLIDKVINHINK